MDAPLVPVSYCCESCSVAVSVQELDCIHTAGDCFQVFARLVYGLAREVSAIAMRIDDGICSHFLPWDVAESHRAYVTWLTLVTGGDCRQNVIYVSCGHG
jgi:hypothetical protein